MPIARRDAGGERLASRLVRVLASSQTTEDAIDGVLREMAHALESPLAALWSHDPEAGTLSLRQDWAADAGFDELRRVARRLTFPRGVGLLGRAVEALEPAVAEDITAAEDFPRIEPALRAGLRSVVAAPLVSSGGVLGVIEFFRREPRMPEESVAAALMAARQLATYLERVRIEDRLRVSEEEGASIVRAALDCIITMDAEGFVLDFNPAAEATFGYEREATLGRRLAELIIPAELREAHRQALHRYVEGGQATILGQRLELNAVRSDGSSLPVELTVTRLGTREPPVFAGFIRDISARRELESQQQRALADAERSRARLAFLAQSGRRMAESMDWEATLGAVVHAAVPVLADAATLTVAEAGGRLRTAAGDAALGADHEAGAARAIRTGEIELSDDERVLVAPLRTPAGVVGALTLSRDPDTAPFAHDDVQLVASFASRASLHIQNARLYTERSHIARTLQASLRPHALPEVPGADIGARFLPAGEHNEVGGDFYDLYPTSDGAWGAIVGDVVGKGAEAAASTALARHTLRTASMVHEAPAAILGLLNRAMIAQGLNDFCTVVYARVCPVGDGIDVRFANGGHPAPLVLRADGRIESLNAGRGPLVGAIARAEFDEASLHLAPGDLLVLYTDGVTEVRTTEPGLGERELRATLAAHRGRSAQEVAEAIERRAVELQPGRPRDDIALLAIRAS